MDARKTLKEIWRAGVAAVNPRQLAQRKAAAVNALAAERGAKRLLVIAAGKGAVPMAAGLCDGLNLPFYGIAVFPAGTEREGLPAGLTAIPAGHPLPDEGSLKGGEEALRLLAEADEHTLAVVLLSGGASALLCAPREGITLGEQRETTKLLLESGAPIEELNTVRKHLSRIKGGGMALRAPECGLVALILSDVVGDPPEVIASGPTVADPTTFADAQEILSQRGLLDRMPPRVAALLKAGVAGTISESAKPDDSCFARCRTVIIGSNALALHAAASKAEEAGLMPVMLTDRLTGEAQEAARGLARQAVAAKRSGETGAMCLLSGGETTVTVRGKGRGGRNQELALAFALEIEDVPGIHLLSAGTDGIDGPTPAAGAFADGRTVRRGVTAGADAEKSLEDNDSFGFFEKAGELFVPGPTGTNVMDLQVIIVE